MAQLGHINGTSWTSLSRREAHWPMIVDEALDFLDKILSGQPLSTIQETVFRHAGLP